ncbi:hypothetical protein GCM10025868_09510 [Angustibacter aerolatus]|uniref:Methyltransferase type 11 domain-containing protein n=1 Tax=Angustibacter aerolatus TaxID=1162965 RepID=A0ABQ6JFZ6_9ACTN|nr:class I SAM-dependent methyltransferase [Angustibacter aerolatus]GMA85701.1 hypothetical protein GCM10025868_09510 [Angustibacter aerolatus]
MVGVLTPQSVRPRRPHRQAPPAPVLAGCGPWKPPRCARRPRLEDAHWWYRERRHLLAREVRGLVPGRALDVGAAGGGNTRVLRALGWDAAALEYGEEGAGVARSRGLATLRADATRLPVADASLDLVVAFDVLEHIEDDDAAVREVARSLRPGGHFVVAVPCDPRLWSEHDEAVLHVRRYTRATLTSLLVRAGLQVGPLHSLERAAAAGGAGAPPGQPGQRPGRAWRRG